MKLALVNLAPIKEMASMQARELADRNSLQQLNAIRDEIMNDMELDPNIEPEGGTVEDQYGDRLNMVDDAIRIKGGDSGEMTYGDMLHKHYPDKYGPGGVALDKDTFTKSSKFDRNEGEDFKLEPEDLDNPDEDLVIIGSGYLDIKNNFKERPSQTNGEYATLGQKVVDQLHKGDKDAALNYIYSRINEVDKVGLNESTESSWNAIDVSRKAEKEIDNKEWNERTAKKLDMLIALNKAGKFKKDWDEEKLQGWVDQNYSWEKLARQFKLNESYLSMYETMHQGEYTAIEQGWDGLPHDEQASIIRDAMDGEARPDDFEKDFDQLKSEIPDFESIVAGYLGIDEPRMREGSSRALQVTTENGVVAIIEDPTDIEAYDMGRTVIGVTADGKKIELNIDWSSESHMVDEGSCGYGPDGVPGDTPGETQGMDADKRTTDMMRKFIQKEVKKLTVGKPPITKEGNPGDFDKGLEDLMGKDDFEKATSNEVPGIGDTVIDDKTDIGKSKKTFMQMMMQFTDEPFLIETGLKLYDAWASGEGGLKPSRILDILKDTSKR